MDKDKARDKIIVALDVSSRVEAIDLTKKVIWSVGMVKIGLQLFTAVGPNIVTEIQNNGGRIFLDLKFNDIPNTVGKAAKEAAKLGVAMFNVHASAGISAMKAAVDNKGNSKVLAVTVLTSLGDNDQDFRNTPMHIFGAKSGEKVFRFAEDAIIAGVDGIVCSPQELTFLSLYPQFQSLLKVTPGIRDVNSPPDDQRRTMTVGEAFLLGADYVVIGRPITEASNPAEAVERFAEQIASAK